VDWEPPSSGTIAAFANTNGRRPNPRAPRLGTSRRRSCPRRRLPGSATTPLRSRLDQEAAAAQNSSRERTIAVLTLALTPVTRVSPAPRLGIGSVGRLSPARIAR
jgi:hypothetical protein